MTPQDQNIHTWDALDKFPALYEAFRDRWAERNRRMDAVVEAVAGRYDVDGPDDEPLDNRSPNFVQVGIVDTAEAASVVPTVRVDPPTMSARDKEIADAMERMAVAYLDSSQFELLNIKLLMNLVAYGMCAAVCYWDPETNSPRIEWRDARFVYPEPGWQTMGSCRRAMIARELYVTQLPEHWKQIVQSHLAAGNLPQPAAQAKERITLVEYVTEEETIVVALYQIGNFFGSGNTASQWQPILLERAENRTNEICPVVVQGVPNTLDGEPHGQFDQVIGLMKAHIRLLGAALDYADQCIYSDIYVSDLIGPLNVGGGGYIQLGPNGKIGRVQPAVTSFTVFQELNQLIDGMHLGARYPKARPGEVSQAIASAKFLEASAGVMNTAIRTYHLVMKRFWEQCLRVCFVIDKNHGHRRTYSGVLRNQQFMIERDPAEIDLTAKVRVEYGVSLGHDPASAAVLGIQMQGAGLVSREFVQENFEGLSDVAKENARIDVEKLNDMMLARLLQGLEEGTIPPEALVKIAKARADGKQLIDLYEEYVVKPQQEQQEQMLQSANGPLMPGMPLEGGVAPGPQAPPPEELLAAIGIGGPAAPEPGSRLNVPLGNGSFVSSNQGI